MWTAENVIGAIAKCVRTTSTLLSHTGRPETATAKKHTVTLYMAFLLDAFSNAFLPLHLTNSLEIFLFLITGNEKRTCPDIPCVFTEQ